MSKRKLKTVSEVMPAKCGTCPFRDGGGTEFLREYLTEASLSEARICHNTGKNNAFHKDTGKPERICRGSRDLQLEFFYRMGFLPAPTDEAWSQKWAEILQGKVSDTQDEQVQSCGGVRGEEDIPDACGCDEASESFRSSS